MAVRFFRFSNVRICSNIACHETADETWLNMKHGHTSKGYDMPWVSEFLWTLDDWLELLALSNALCMTFVKLMAFKPSLFCKAMRSCCLMSASFRYPGRALGALGVSSFTGFSKLLPSHFDNQTWPLLHDILQRAKISNASAYELEWNCTGSYSLLHYRMFCASKTKSKMGWVESESMFFSFWGRKCAKHTNSLTWATVTP